MYVDVDVDVYDVHKPASQKCKRSQSNPIHTPTTNPPKQTRTGREVHQGAADCAGGPAEGGEPRQRCQDVHELQDPGQSRFCEGCMCVSRLRGVWVGVSVSRSVVDGPAAVCMRDNALWHPPSARSIDLPSPATIPTLTPNIPSNSFPHKTTYTHRAPSRTSSPSWRWTRCSRSRRRARRPSRARR